MSADTTTTTPTRAPSRRPTGAWSSGDVFTTGQVARICAVCPRVVNAWIDSGQLRGYRVPGSKHRRVVRAELVRFLKDSGMPLGDLEHDPDTPQDKHDLRKALEMLRDLYLDGEDQAVRGRAAGLLVEFRMLLEGEVR